jgi:DNA-directed RNA polymerase specialized sigma24 family protein
MKMDSEIVKDNAVAFQKDEKIEQDPFEFFFLQNYKKVFGLLYRLTGERMQAEDLTVETFVRYLHNPPERNDNPQAWLFQVATRLGYNSLRQLNAEAITKGAPVCISPVSLPIHPKNWSVIVNVTTFDPCSEKWTNAAQQFYFFIIQVVLIRKLLLL